MADMKYFSHEVMELGKLWSTVLRFITQANAQSEAQSMTTVQQAVECAAAALLSRQSAMVLAEVEAEEGFTGGYAPLTRAAQRVYKRTDLKGEAGRAARADAACVLAILGTTGPAAAANLISNSIVLRPGHFRQHMLRCGMRLAGESDSALADALADARAARGCATTELERWEAGGMIGSCLAQMDRPEQSRAELEAFVAAAFDEAGDVASLLNPSDEARAVGVMFQLASICVGMGDVPEAEKWFSEVRLPTSRWCDRRRPPMPLS